MTNLAIWHGTTQEFKRLIAVLAQYCECDTDNPASPPCAAHKMVTEQRVLDGLEFVLRKKLKYITAEQNPLSEWF